MIVPDALQACAYDFDGTLADTYGVHSRAERAAFATLAIRDERYLLSDAVFDQAYLHGTTPQQIGGWLLTKARVIPEGVDPLAHPALYELVELKESIYHRMAAKGFDAMDGAVEAVLATQELFAGNVALVTTADYQHEVLPFLQRHHQLLGVFTVVVAREHTAAHHVKPHSFAYQYGAVELGVAPARMAAIEDSPRGLEAAAGCYRVGVAGPYPRERLHNHADVVVDNLRHVTPRLAAYNQIMRNSLIS